MEGTEDWPGSPIIRVPDGFTAYDKIVIQEGSKTVREVLDWLQEHRGMSVELAFTITC